MLVGMLMQTIAGYYHYEVLQYVQGAVLSSRFPQMLAFALFAMFVQTMVSNKFIGHGIVIGVFVLQPMLFSFGWENTLYLPGAVPAYIYSDMNGYGHFVPALFWSITYWFAIFALLARRFHCLQRGAAPMIRWRAHAVWRCGALRAWRRPAALFLLLARRFGPLVLLQCARAATNT